VTYVGGLARVVDELVAKSGTFDRYDDPVRDEREGDR
jgi:hypothetical protein